MPPDDANFSTPLGGWKVSALHSTFLRGKCERFWTLPGSDVFLGKAIVPHQRPVGSGAKDQAVIVPQAHSRRGAAHPAEAMDQGFFQCQFRGFGTARGLQGPAQNLPGAAVDHRGEHTPAVPAAVNQPEVGGPSLVWLFGDGGRMGTGLK